MPKPKFAKKRRFRKPRRVKVKSKARRDMPTRLICRQPGGFPDRYFARLKVVGQNTLVAAVNNYIAWNFATITQPNAFGPNINNGGFQTNYPSGVSMLISNPGTAANVAPYSQYRVHGCTMTVKINPGSSGPQMITAVLVPSTRSISSYGASTSYPQLAEQAHSVTRSVSGNQTNRPLYIKKFISSRRLLGIKHKAAYEALQSQWGGYNTQPSTGLYHNLYLSGDGTTNLVGLFEWEAIVFVEFFNRNSDLSTAAPT